MRNPYLDRVIDRMKRDNAVQQLQAHWSVRLCRTVDRGGRFLEQAGMHRLSNAYTDATTPITNWLADRQARFLMDRWF
jgi:hypothetical protein